MQGRPITLVTFCKHLRKKKEKELNYVKKCENGAIG